MTFGRLRSVFDFGQLPKFPGVRSSARKAGFSDKRLHPQLQIFGGCRIKAKIDLARIDQIVALSPSKTKAVELAAIKRITGEGQGFALDDQAILSCLISCSQSFPAGTFVPRVGMQGSKVVFRMGSR